MPAKTAAVLYLSYDGMLEPLGQSQVLAYLQHLAEDRSIHLISFEKSVDWMQVAERERVSRLMQSFGIQWHPLTYHKRPTGLATAWDILCGIALGRWLCLRHAVRIVHARSYVTAVMALVLQRLCGLRFVFDMRGFWADERVDGGLWPRNGYMFRAAKGFERRFLQRADHVISLTHAAVHLMQEFVYLRERRPPFTVIPTCADLTHFRPPEKNGCDAASGREGFVLGYVGSASTWYLFDEVLRCFGLLLTLRPQARLLVLNRSEHEYIRQCLARHALPASQVTLVAAAHHEVPQWIARMDAGIFFIKPTFSKMASAPTKLAEFLGCGKPCLGNQGVGDMAEVLQTNRVGIALAGLDDAQLRQGVGDLLALCEDPDVSRRCVDVAQRQFSLVAGVAAYRRVYQHFDTQV